MQIVSSGQSIFSRANSVDPNHTPQNAASDTVYLSFSRFWHSIYAKYSDIQARYNSVDPDQTSQSVASDQDLHCLPPIQQFLYINM